MVQKRTAGSHPNFILVNKQSLQDFMRHCYHFDAAHGGAVLTPVREITPNQKDFVVIDNQTGEII